VPVLKITFLLPSAASVPIGGFKVVYGFSSTLVHRGHSVSVIHPARVGPLSLLQVGRTIVGLCARGLGLKETWKPISWHTPDRRVRLLWRPFIHDQFIPAGDAVIATAWNTAERVATLSSEKGKKFYLIQNQEELFDDASPTRARATWKLPLRKMTTGQWLVNLGSKMGENVDYVGQGFDYDSPTFEVDKPIRQRPPSVAMLYHTATWKGSAEGIRALELTKRIIPSLRATLFGVPSRPATLPAWISYLQTPTSTQLRNLYNSVAVFLSPSWVEGCALPPGEAAQCGAALCLTDIGGHADYAQQGITALLSPPRDIGALATNLQRLLTDARLRETLAQNGHERIATFSWKRSADLLEAVLLRGLESPIR